MIDQIMLIYLAKDGNFQHGKCGRAKLFYTLFCPGFFLVAKEMLEGIESPKQRIGQAAIDKLLSKIGEEKFATLLVKVKPQAHQLVDQRLHSPVSPAVGPGDRTNNSVQALPLRRSTLFPSPKLLEHTLASFAQRETEGILGSHFESFTAGNIPEGRYAMSYAIAGFAEVIFSVSRVFEIL
jgi:hypothetical protein